jgi:ATP-binding cassette, subfamily A (ABC1), member 3
MNYPATQYGAIFFTHEFDSVVGSNGSSFNDTVVNACVGNVEGFSFTTPSECQRFAGVGYLIQYNFSAFHISPTLQAVATEALARQALGVDEFSVQATIAALPLTKVESAISKSDDAFTAWFLVVLSFPFIAGAFATFIVQERESKAKHLQTVAGVEPWAYWLSTYMWDVLNYLIPMTMTVIFMFLFDVGVLTSTARNVFGGVLALFFLFGPAMAGFTYCLSFGFSNANLCNIIVIISGFLVGMGGPITCFILEIIGTDTSNPNSNLVDIAKIIAWILRFHPCFCLGRGIFYAINIDTIDIWYEGIDTVWDGHVLLYDVIFLGWQSVLYIALAVQMDSWSSNPKAVARWNMFIGLFTCSCLFSKKNEIDITVALPEDSDVIEEQDRVLNGGANDDLIVVSELTKVYSNGKKAVNNLSFGISHGTSSSFFSCGLY